MQGITWICSISYMLIANIPDPILGPKGVRLLLLTRGLFGSVFSCLLLSLAVYLLLVRVDSLACSAYTTVFNTYISRMQQFSRAPFPPCLPVSRINKGASRFLSPLTTAIAGALLLDETFARKEAFAGSGSFSHLHVLGVNHISKVFGLIGVVLIARATFIFGDASLPVDGGASVSIIYPSVLLSSLFFTVIWVPAH